MGILMFHSETEYLTLKGTFFGNYKPCTNILAVVEMYMNKVAIYPRPQDVLEIHMSKPRGFKYKSGQYIYVKCPSISHLQWHPFSITSAPAEDHLNVHIRTLGDWTTEL